MDLSKVINDLLDTLSKRDLNHVIQFYDDAFIFELVPEQVSIKGISAWYKAIEEFFNWVDEGRKELLRCCQQNDIIWIERIDHWKINGTWVAIPIMAVVQFTKESKVLNWREYHTLEYRRQFDSPPETGFSQNTKAPLVDQ